VTTDFVFPHHLSGWEMTALPRSKGFPCSICGAVWVATEEGLMSVIFIFAHPEHGPIYRCMSCGYEETIL